jgi:hypothetical protein
MRVGECTVLGRAAGRPAMLRHQERLYMIEMSTGDVLLASFANFFNTGHACWNVNVSGNENKIPVMITGMRGWGGAWHCMLTTARCRKCACECIVVDRVSPQIMIGTHCSSAAWYVCKYATPPLLACYLLVVI